MTSMSPVRRGLRIQVLLLRSLEPRSRSSDVKTIAFRFERFLEVLLSFVGTEFSSPESY